MGQEAINWNGALRLLKGVGAFIGGYDGNGNLTSRVVNGAAYILTYDAVNHMVSVSGGVTASFVYDGDGKRVKGTVTGTTTTYISNYFEWSGSTSTMKRYYYAGSTHVAMRTGSNTINYLLGDHLGSTSITTDSNGANPAEIRYYPWGKERYTSGTTPTNFKFTGQRYESTIGLYYYGSRWYDPYLNRWIQPDSIIPDPYNSTDLDRYAYSRNNPTNLTDPTGHCVEGNDDFEICMEWATKIEEEWEFVDVITCLSGDSAEGCIGWTAKEMELLNKTLSEFPLSNSIDDSFITVIRFNSDDYAGQYDPSSGEIRITDSAWKIPALMGIQDFFDPLFSSSDHFQGVIAHELVHVAQHAHPELRDKYKEVINQISPFDNFLFHLTVGVFYDWDEYDKYKGQPYYDQMIQDEYMALVVSGFIYDWP